MADISVDTNSINGMTQNINDAVSRLEQTLKQMHEGVNELNATWSGPNHDTFISNFEARYGEVKQVNEMLKKYLESVKKAKKEYVSFESQVEDIVNRERF